MSDTLEIQTAKTLKFFKIKAKQTMYWDFKVKTNILHFKKF